MKILLPVDGSVYTGRTLSWIAAHADLLGPSHDYTVLTVVTPVPAYASQLLQDQTLDRYYREEAEHALGPVRTFVEQQRWKARLTYDFGNPADAIVALAGKDASDLIVMGSHGRTALGNLLHGSVAGGVLARCGVPVLLIR